MKWIESIIQWINARFDERFEAFTIHCVMCGKWYLLCKKFIRRPQRKAEEAVAYTFSTRPDPELSWGRIQRTGHSLNKSTNLVQPWWLVELGLWRTTPQVTLAVSWDPWTLLASYALYLGRLPVSRSSVKVKVTGQEFTVTVGEKLLKLSMSLAYSGMSFDHSIPLWKSKN